MRMLAVSSYSTEEIIVKSMIAAEDMIGLFGISVNPLSHDKKYNRT